MVEQRGSVVLIDDEEDVLHSGTQTLELEGIGVHAFRAAESALEILTPGWCGIVLTDVKMPGMDGMELLRQVRAVDPELPVILITGHGDVAMALQAIRDGAYDFIEKPAAPEQLIDVVQRALEKRRLVLENRALRRELESLSGMDSRIVGRSEGIERVRRTIANIADTGVDILIEGETGTGKELVARCLHDFSDRRDKRFVALNCGALPESIIESELFGHETGAFTGAVKRRIGKLEFAHEGTVFLDEIESMPISLQVKLLRVLQERTIERLGGNESVPIDVRVVAATKLDLMAEAEAGRFREDLYYRLNVARIAIPPLRERRSDVPLLFHHFLGKACRRFNRDVPEVPEIHMANLMARSWPGNVRELGNAAERYALALSDLQAQDTLDSTAAGNKAPMSLEAQLDAFERQIVASALHKTGGRVGQAAETLGIQRKTLYLRMRKFGFDRKDFVGDGA